MITPIKPVGNVTKLPLKQKKPVINTTKTLNTIKMDLAWAREKIHGFAKMQDAAIQVKASEAEYKKLLGSQVDIKV